MARNQGASRPVENMLALSRLWKDCYYEPIRVDFSPIEKPSQQLQQIIPRYNNDGQYFTSSFILPRERITTEQGLKTQKSKFDSRRAHYKRQIQDKQDKTPEYKPTDNNYCQLCQQEFSCYWEHVNSKYHKRMINTSKFNKDIIALCETMRKTATAHAGGKTKTIQKKKTISKSSSKAKSQRNPVLKQSSQTKAKESTITMDNGLSNSSCPMNISRDQQKKLQESLKITLQLGNHSTNLLSNNTFKEVFKNI